MLGGSLSRRRRSGCRTAPSEPLSGSVPARCRAFFAPQRASPPFFLVAVFRLADDHFDAAILLPAIEGRIVRNGRTLATTRAAETVSLHSATDEIAPHRIRATLGQGLVGVVTADVVRESFDRRGTLGILAE